jgi:PAS domain S-box-containing protein
LSGGQDFEDRPDPARDDALVESELRLRRLVEHALDAVVTIDDSGNILEWNEEAERTFGWTRAEAIGENAFELLVPERRRDEVRSALHSSDAEVLNRRLEVVALGRNGIEVPVEVSVVPLFWRGRRIFTAFARDISERVRAAAEARHFEAVIDAAANAVIGLALDGTILSWNRTAERMYGYTMGEIRGSPVARLLPSEQIEGILHKIGWGIADDSRSLAVRRDQSTFRILRALRPIQDDRGQPLGAVLICNDLSANEELEQKLKNEEYLASLGRVASTVGHEFNNVLMGIQPFIDLIDRYATDRRLKEAAGHMRRSIQRGRQITEEMRAFSSASAPLKLHAVPVENLASALEHQLRAVIKPGIELVMEIEARNVTIICHLAQVTQAVVNVGLNAQDAMPNGGRVTVRVAMASHDSVEISVADTGRGMTEEMLRRMFEPLFTTREKGTGLGLAVVRYIIDRHGGSIDVWSKPGQGTVFRIRLRAVAP